MKRLVLWSLIVIMLLGSFGCKKENQAETATVDEFVEQKTSESGAGNAPEKNEEVKEAKEVEVPSSAPVEEPAAETEQEKYFDEILRTYDAADYRDYWAQLEQLIYERNNPQIVYPGWTFSKVMEELGEDGLVVAGYVEGQCEEHRYYDPDSAAPYYTLSDFVVTDVYQGAEPPAKIRIRDEYCLMEADGTVQMITIHDGDHFLAPGRKVLLFLKKNGENIYSRVYHPIYLTEDYRDYSEGSLKSLLDYYRGEKSVYRELESEFSAETYIEDNQTIYVLKEATPDYWPAREISDAALIAELQEHILVRTATEYRIALWPTQHVNYTIQAFSTGHRDLGLEARWKEACNN